MCITLGSTEMFMFESWSLGLRKIKGKIGGAIAFHFWFDGLHDLVVLIMFIKS